MATMWIQYVFNSSYGFLTNLFKALHLDFLADVQWLDADHKFWALLISYCFGMIGHFMLIWVSGIERIGKDYYEAASIDGANKVGQLLYITLPLLKGIFRTNVIMWSISVSGFLSGPSCSRLFPPTPRPLCRWFTCTTSCLVRKTPAMWYVMLVRQQP